MERSISIKRSVSFLMMVVCFFFFPICSASQKEFELREIAIKGTTNNYFELGTTLTISVNSNYFSKSVSYRFSYQYRDGEEKIISDYSASSKIEWIPELSGTYLIIAEGTTDDGQYGKQTKEITVINPNKVEITGIEFDKESPQNVGEAITVKVNADKGTGPYRYKFIFSQREEDKEGSSPSEWIDTDTYIWVPDSAATYTIKIMTEDSGGQIVSAEKTYTITESSGADKEAASKSLIRSAAGCSIMIGTIIFVFISRKKKRKK